MSEREICRHCEERIRGVPITSKTYGGPLHSGCFRELWLNSPDSPSKEEMANAE